MERTNLDALISAGIVPPDHTLTEDDIDTVNALSTDEVDSLIALKARLGDDFLERNARKCPNCFL